MTSIFAEPLEIQIHNTFVHFKGKLIEAGRPRARSEEPLKLYAQPDTTQDVQEDDASAISGSNTATDGYDHLMERRWSEASTATPSGRPSAPRVLGAEKEQQEEEEEEAFGGESNDAAGDHVCVSVMIDGEERFRKKVSRKIPVKDLTKEIMRQTQCGFELQDVHLSVQKKPTGAVAMPQGARRDPPCTVLEHHQALDHYLTEERMAEYELPIPGVLQINMKEVKGCSTCLRQLCWHGKNCSVQKGSCKFCHCGEQADGTARRHRKGRKSHYGQRPWFGK